jgi:hypothetical protein
MVPEIERQIRATKAQKKNLKAIFGWLWMVLWLFTDWELLKGSAFSAYK